MAVLRGHLLIAAPRLVDPNFRRTVVLVILHDEKGAFGVVLNRPAGYTVAELWAALGEPPCDRQEPVFVGGPVPGPVLALHTRAEDSEREVVPGVHFSAHKEQLDRVVRQTERPFRLFAGYSGWGAGQLERELQDGGWMTLPATAAAVFGEPEHAWAQAIQRFGRQITDPLLGRVPPPPDPSAN